jgi:hypothetical protein
MSAITPACGRRCEPARSRGTASARRLSLIVVALVLALALPASGAVGGARAGAPTPSLQRAQPAAFHFGTRRRSFGGGLLRSRRRTHPVLRHVVHALAFAYLLHLFFTHGGLSVLLWLVIIGLVVHLMRRRRRGRTRYSA